MTVTALQSESMMLGTGQIDAFDDLLAHSRADWTSARSFST
jgi:hypothetical protein